MPNVETFKRSISIDRTGCGSLMRTTRLSESIILMFYCLLLRDTALAASAACIATAAAADEADEDDQNDSTNHKANNRAKSISGSALILSTANIVDRAAIGASLVFFDVPGR